MNIILVFGGRSVEEKISVITALKIYRSLLNSPSYSPVLVYQDPQSLKFYGGAALESFDNYKHLHKFKKARFFKKGGKSYVKVGHKKHEFDLIFPVVHGANTEDGTLASFFITQGFVTLTPPLSASALAQDKILFKYLLKALRIKALKSTSISCKQYLDNILNLGALIKPLKFPLIIKPFDLGSSIGIKVTYNIDELIKGLEEAFKLTELVLLEEYLAIKSEINIGLIKGLKGYYFSAAEKIIKDKDIYSYCDKYIKPNIKKELPAIISSEALALIKSQAQTVYERMSLKGVVRFDFFLVDDEVYLNEVNTIPGSYAAHLFALTNLDIKDLLDIYIQESSSRIMKLSKFENVKENSLFDKVSSTSKFK